MSTNFLKEVAKFIGSSKLEKELLYLEGKREDCPIVLPFMGEFSSGKTSLINALTDCKQLETATTPTTATIYEVHFGCEKCFAEVVFPDNKRIHVDTISELHNEEIADASVVEVYDTSDLVSSSIILVDTPGLSSSDPRHKQTLIEFLPEADGILLVSDINQPGLTKSLTDFIKTMELSKRRIYLILTKCDTKSEKEICEAKRYIEANNSIKQSNIVSVSAKDNNVSELLNLLKEIQRDKAEIMEQVNKQRIINIAQQLANSIATLKKTTLSDDELDEVIEEQQHRLRKLNSSIEKMMDSLSDEIKEISRKAERTYEDTVFARLDSIVGNKGIDYDVEALSVVNNTASLIISNMRADIRNCVRKHAKDSRSEVIFSSLDNVDLDSFSVDGFAYNLNLNSLGHEYDGHIAKGLKIAAAVAAVCVAAPAVAGAGTVGAAGAAEAAAGSSIAEYGVADLVIDATQTAAIMKGGGVIEPSQPSASGNSSRKEQIMQKYDEYEQQNMEIAQRMGMNGGVVESIVGLVTDSTMGKPQRRRAIQEYMDSTLMPSFRAAVERNCNLLLSTIHKGLVDDSTIAISELKDSLSKLKEEKRSKEDDFAAKIKQLSYYSTTLKNEYLCGNF